MIDFLEGIVARFALAAADPGDSETVRLRKGMVLGATAVFVPVVIPWSILYFAMGYPLAGAIPGCFSLFSAISLAYYYRSRNFRFLRLSQQTLMSILPFLLTLVLGGFTNSSAVILWASIAPMGSLATGFRREARFWLALFLALLCSAAILEPFLPYVEPLPSLIVTILYVANIGVVTMLAFFLIFYFLRESELAYTLLRQEQEKSERLLLNVLPQEIAEILKEGNRTVARRYETATILFADMVSFTPLSASMSPEAMVEMLNEMFTEFDTMLEKYGLEKIRTIGDNYMAAAGVPTPRVDHALAVAAFALDMNDYLHRRPAHDGQRIRFRIGIHSGPLVAGVIGRSKFHYDVWGDVVNTASRMESHGVPDRIQISRATYDLVQERFECEARGSIPVKGKGQLETWFLLGRRSRQTELPET